MVPFRILIALLVLFPWYADGYGGQIRPHLTVYYFDRPPFYIADQGKPGGFLINFFARVLQRSGISASFEERTPKRILRLLLTEPNACSVGWFQTPERRQKFKFIGPIYISPPPILLVTSDSVYSKQISKTDFEQIAASGRLIVRCGFSYGVMLDEILSRFDSVTCLHGDTISLVKMLAGRRIPSLLIDCEEWGSIIINNPHLKQRLKALYLDNFVPPNPRYIMCSKKIDPEIVYEIKGQLKALVPWLQREQ